MGLVVQTKIAHTGVVAILKGSKPGKTLALRADIDGLPVPERADLSFKSKAKGEYNGEEVPVMHACGHDTHIAILMGVADILSKNKVHLLNSCEKLNHRLFNLTKILIGNGTTLMGTMEQQLIIFLHQFIELPTFTHELKSLRES